jgi:hypothetical protein
MDKNKKNNNKNNNKNKINLNQDQSDFALSTPEGDTPEDDENNNIDFKMNKKNSNIDLKMSKKKNKEVELKINISINDNNLDNIFEINDKNKDLNNINVIYHDENLKYGGSEIVSDCQRIERSTKGTIILCNDLENLNLLLKDLTKKAQKSKFAFIVNGSSADKIVNFINTNNYKDLFIKACIYTSNLSKYSSVKDKYSDFIEVICLDCEKIINFVNKTFENLTINNERFIINSLIINFPSYKREVFPLHKEISTFYCDEAENAFSVNYNSVKDFIGKSEYSDDTKEELLTYFGMFSEINKKNYEKIITTYLKNSNFSQLLNTLLLKKDMSIIKTIGFFVAKLMYSLVEYGKKMKKGVVTGKTLYKGMELNIIDLLEFVKNNHENITFPYFFSITADKKLAENFSKRNMPEKDRKEKGIYSVIMKIDYLYDDGYEPSIFEIKDLAPYPDEEEYIVLPYTFLKLKNAKIDSSKLFADIELEVIGKKEILEYKIKDLKEIKYNKKEHIMSI